MNQNLQIIQTLLILAVCVSVAFLVGKQSGSEKVAPTLTNLAPSSSLTTLNDIQNLKQQLLELEVENSNDKKQWELINQNLQTLEENLIQSSQILEALSKQSNSKQQEIQTLNEEIEKLKESFDENFKENVEIAKSSTNLTQKPQEATPRELSPKEKILREQQASNLFNQIEPQFRNHMALKKYGDARYILINFPSTLQETYAGRKVTALLAQIDKQILLDFEELEKRSLELINKENFNAAQDLLKSVPNRFPNKLDFQKRAEKILIKLNSKKRQSPPSFSSTNKTFSSTQIRDLIKEMGSEDFNEAKKAQENLLKIGRQALKEIREGTEHLNSKIRWGCIVLLGQLGTKEQDENLLISALRDSDSQIRYSSLESLEKLKSYKAIDEIIKTAKDNDFKIAKKAIETFESITGYSAVIGNTQITKRNVKNFQEMIGIYWERHRGDFLKP